MRTARRSGSWRRSTANSARDGSRSGTSTGRQHPLSFSLGFRTGGLRARAGHAEDEAGGFGVVRVHVGGISTQELAEMRDHDAVLAESTRHLLRSQVIIPLVDASHLPSELGVSPSPPLARYDHELAVTLDLLSRFLSAERSRKGRAMHLLFVLTKLDRCSPATVADWGAPSGAPATWPAAERQKVGENILERFLPATNRFLADLRRRLPGAMESPQWYFSGLRLEENGSTPRIARRSRLPFGGWEPEYPFEEYPSAHRTPGLARSSTAPGHRGLKRGHPFRCARKRNPSP